MINKMTDDTWPFLKWSRWLAWVGPLFGLGFLTLLWKRFQRQPAKKDKKPEARRDPPSERLIKECAHLIDELATQQDRLSGDARDLADHVIFRICEVVQRAGATVIDNDASFDRDRHQVSGSRLPAQGEVILETMVPGLQLGQQIILRARIRT